MRLVVSELVSVVSEMMRGTWINVLGRWLHLICKSFSHEGVKGRFRLLSVLCTILFGLRTGLLRLYIQPSCAQTCGNSCIECFSCGSCLKLEQKTFAETIAKLSFILLKGFSSKACSVEVEVELLTIVVSTDLAEAEVCRDQWTSDQHQKM